MLTTPGGNRRKFRRLPHHSIPRGKRRRELPRRQQERRIPWRDCGDHSERLFTREIEYARLVDRDHAALDLVREPAEIVEPLRNIFQLPAHFGDQLAIVGRLDFGKAIRFGGDQLGETPEQFTARRCSQLAPFTIVECRFRGCHGAVHVRLRPAGDHRPRLPRKRIHRFEPRAGRRLDPLPARQHAMFRQLTHRRRHFARPLR